MIRRAGLALTLACLLGAGLQAEAFKLKAEATVHGPRVLAAEVLDPAPTGILGEVVVGTVGKPGSKRSVLRDQVQLRLSRAGSGEKVEVVGPQACQVSASKRALEGKALLSFAGLWLKEQLQGLSSTARVEVLAPSAPKDQLVPDREVRLSVRPMRGQALRGPVVLSVAATQLDEQGQELEVGGANLSFKVTVVKPQLLASRAIAKGERLGPENSALAERDTSYAAEEGFGDTLTAWGLVAKRPIASGAVVLPASVELPLTVKAGDMVRLVARAGMVRVETPARVLREGRKGETIPVQVIQTKKQVSAMVLDERTVVADAL